MCIEGKGFIVPNGVASPETDPLGDRAVLLLRLGELLLRAERLVALQGGKGTCQLTFRSSLRLCLQRPTVRRRLGRLSCVSACLVVGVLCHPSANSVVRLGNRFRVQAECPQSVIVDRRRRGC